MNEIYLLLVMILGIVFGYFVSKSAHEELNELSFHLKIAYALTAAAVFGVAAYFKLWYSIIVFIIMFFLIYLYNNSMSQKAVLFTSGVLIFLVKELFLFSVILFINLMILATINYNKKFFKNVSVYLYFLIPALIVFLLKFFLRV